MLVQNSNSKISAPPDLAPQLLQILIPTTFTSLSWRILSKRISIDVHFRKHKRDGLLGLHW